MNLIEQLKRDEGQVLHVYLDSRQIRTAGCGHNLQAHSIDWPVGTPITQAQCDQWLEDDIAAAEHSLKIYLPWTDQLDEVRRAVLINMCFNMGIHALLGFKNMLAAIETGDYAMAALGMIHSAWATQVKGRAERLAKQMETGEWQ